MRKEMNSLRTLVLTTVAAVVALVLMTGQAFAVDETGRTDYTLANGVTESTVYVTDSLSNNIRVHILRIQQGADVSLRAAYKDYYKKGSTKKSRKAYAKKWSKKKWGYAKMTATVSAYNKAKNTDGQVIAAASGDFYTGKGIPCGYLVMEGNVVKKSKKEPFFAVTKDGRAEIRSASSSVSDVEEAIAGKGYLVRDNAIAVSSGGNREPRQAIGVCADGTVVIVSVDGRDPSSPGATLYDLASICKQQECKAAINLDGGGSASLLTKRGGGSVQYRTIASDSFVRNVSDMLLVVKNKKSSGRSITGKAVVSMAYNNTSLTEGGGVYQYTIRGRKPSGFYTVNGNTYLLKDGKGVNDSVVIGGVTYTFNRGLLTGKSDGGAGQTVIGYCGGTADGRNLLYAYQWKNAKLNIGRNPYDNSGSGVMADWSVRQLDVPWYAFRSKVKKVTVDEGVTTIGGNFLFISTVKGFDGSTQPTCKLTTVKLPGTLQTIGKKAFFYKPKLKNMVVPAGVRSIGESAFANSGTGSLKFKGTKPPKFRKAVFAKGGFKAIYVKKTPAWKKCNLKKYGFRKSKKFY